MDSNNTNNKKMLTPPIRIEDLSPGKFAKMNGSVVYRFKPVTQAYWLDGVWIVEKHNHLSTWDVPERLEEDGQNHFYVIPIETPQKKHVDNALLMLKDALKHKQIDNLSYVENWNTLKNYLKSDIIKKKSKKVNNA